MNLSHKFNISKDKVLIIETVLYGIVIILAVYLSVYGMLIFKLIPILFIVGLVSRFIFDRPIILSLFGFSISLLIIEIGNKNTLEYNFLYSLYTMICLYTGALCSRYILSIKHSKAKNFTATKAHNMTLAILTIFVGIFFNIYVNGDLISYLKAKQNVEKYIESNYSELRGNYTLSNPTFISSNINYYSFTLSSDKIGLYKVGAYLDGKIIDGYKDSKIKSLNLILSNKFKFKYEELLKSNFKVSFKYIDLNNISVTLDKHLISLDESEIDNSINEIDAVIQRLKEIDEYENILKITVCIKSENESYVADIYKEEFGNIDKYKEKFLVEFFDL